MYKIKNVLTPLPIGSLQLKGRLGDILDRTAEKRIISEFALKVIYPETEEAFRRRIDDRDIPGRGVWRGEFWGKWMLSAIAACRYYKDESLELFIARAVEGLLSTQESNGYIGTYHDPGFTGPSWNIWCRKYTLWALVEAYELLKDEKILDAAVKFTDHLISEVGPGKKEIIETGYFCGMPSTSILGPIIRLFNACEKKRFLDYGLYIVDQWSRHPGGLPNILENGLKNRPVHLWGNNPEEWAKGYELISCVEGLLELYCAVGTREYLTAAENIHSRLVLWERSPVGSVGFNDKFVGSRFLKNTVSEICDAVYWNRLSHKLLCLTGDISYLDEIEKSLYNALLSGINRDCSWALRRLRLTHEHIPAHNHFLRRHQCCVDNLPRGYFQAAESAVLQSPSGIYIGLYNELDAHVCLLSGKNISLSLKGNLYDSDSVDITFTHICKAEFSLFLRIPYWSKTMSYGINEESPVICNGAGFQKITRAWQHNDRVRITFDLSIRRELFEADRNRPDQDIISWHEDKWSKMGLIMEESGSIDPVENTTLRKEDALPHRSGAVLFRGPFALSRDERLEKKDVFAPMSCSNIVTVMPCKPPDGIYRSWTIKYSDGSTVLFCDFASAGNNWGANERFNTYV